MPDWYDVGAWITGAITFVGIWIYCSLTYGFIGFALGWMPAGIVAVVCAFVWPLVAALLALAIALGVVAFVFFALK